MERDDVIRAFLASKMFAHWHWFSYHFQFYGLGREHCFAKSLVDAIVNIGKSIPGYPLKTITKIASLSNRERYQPHYEQLIQVCAEIYVLNKAVDYFGNSDKYQIIDEPTADGSDMNPEFIVVSDQHTFGVEVKSPSLIRHMNTRYENPAQISTRVPGLLASTKELVGDTRITLPRDNPVKDFLISANNKFEKFKATDSNFISILFILWDDFIYEPISALVGKPSGLFLNESYATDDNGDRITFPNIDAVILDRHQINIIKATRDEELNDNKKHAMDYGVMNEFPFKAVIPCPDGNMIISKDIRECFQLNDWDSILGAEYSPSDLVFWLHAIDKKS